MPGLVLLNRRRAARAMLHTTRGATPEPLAAGEVMAVVEMAMMAGVTHGKLADAILAHPTMSEGLGIFSDLPRPSLQRITPGRAT